MSSDLAQKHFGPISASTKSEKSRDFALKPSGHNENHLVTPLIVRGKVDIIQEYGHRLSGGRSVGGPHPLVHIGLHLLLEQLWCGCGAEVAAHHDVNLSVVLLDMGVDHGGLG